jgi:SP family myo-inositol transporter-like MFS transporter 13
MGLLPFVEGNVVSIAIAGEIVGALIAGWVSEKYGRKMAIYMADCIFIVGSIIMAAAASVIILIIGRFVVGFGIGVVVMVVPVYLAETAPEAMRGAMITTGVLFITGG